MESQGAVLNEQVTPASASTNTTATNYAGFWLRLCAVFVDSVLLGLMGLILSSLLQAEPVQSGVGVILGWLYYAYMESSHRQATFGKMVMKIKVTDEEGNRVTFARATGRHFAKILSALIIMIGYLMVLWTKKKQGLHDILAKTLVVRK